MGCTTSSPSSGTSSSNNSPEDGARLPVAFANMKQEKSRTLAVCNDPAEETTYPPDKEPDDGESNRTCGRLLSSFRCCRLVCSTIDRGYHHHHYHHHHRRSSKTISASLTALHSFDPDSVPVLPSCNNSGTCSPKPLLLSSSVRSSCASLCSVCQQPQQQPLSADDKQSSNRTSPRCSADIANVNSSSFDCGACGSDIINSGGSVTKHHHLSALVCKHQQQQQQHHHRTEGTRESDGSGHSSDNVRKCEKKSKKTQTKSMLNEEGICTNDKSESFTLINSTLSNKDGHNRAANLPILNDIVTKESTTRSTLPTDKERLLCCVKHQHRYYRHGGDGRGVCSGVTSQQHMSLKCAAFSAQHKYFTQLSSTETTTATTDTAAIAFETSQLQSHHHHHHHHQKMYNVNTYNYAESTSPAESHLDGKTMMESTRATTEKLNFAHQFCARTQSVKLGRMKIESKKVKVLLVLNKADSQANTLRIASQRVDFAVSCVDSAEAALNAFVETQPEIVIIDARNSSLPSSASSSSATCDDATVIQRQQQLQQQQQPQQQPQTQQSGKHRHSRRHHPPIVASGDASSAVPVVIHSGRAAEHSCATTLNASQLCQSMRNIKGSEFTCILALVSRRMLESLDVTHFLQNGFNRFFEETDNLSHCVAQFLQLREFELNMQRRLRAASALFAAIDACKDGVVITGPRHDIQFANNSIEKMFGFRLEDIIGKNAKEFFQSDLIKEDIKEKINNFNEGKEWEGQIYHRRKSGDSVPIWNRILPINYHNGSPEFIIYVKEFPFLFIEKLMSPDSEPSFNYGSLKGFRKTSFDVKSEVRRPSLAKFNSVSMIEAPITRVINILIAIKEEGPSFLAPTLEKAIDILKNSEIFLPQFQSFRPEDPLTSELVSSLINTNKTGVRRMSHEAASNKSSISISYPHTPPFAVTQPSLSNVPTPIQSLLDDDLSWSFNVIELERITQKRPLAWLGLSILNRFNVCQTLQCSETTLRNWLTVIESNYHDNPYHNSTHAADVMQATAHFLMCQRLKSLFDPMDQAICLIAAIIHDIDHPGRNSAFLCNSSHELAILYNDISVLESHHAAKGFKLTVGHSDDSVNIFKKLEPEMYRDVRQSVIDMVLATDMTKHFEHLAKFVNVFQSIGLPDDTLFEMENAENRELESSKPFNRDSRSDLGQFGNAIFSTPENIVLIKRMLIKCADVSNPARPLRLCQTWAERISTEYCDQTDEEKKTGLPVVMPTFDRLTCSIPKSQIGFIDYFANDMFEAWHSFGNFQEIVENINTNYQYWKEQQILLEKKHKKLSLESRKVSDVDEESVTSQKSESIVEQSCPVKTENNEGSGGKRLSNEEIPISKSNHLSPTTTC